MKFDTWKVLFFFSTILLMAYNIYPSHLEMAALLEKSQLYELSIDEFKFVIETEKSVPNLSKIAYLYELVDDLDTALSYYNRLIELQPDNSDVHKTLIRIYSWNREPAKVIAEYERYLKNVPINTVDPVYMKEVYTNLRTLYANQGEKFRESYIDATQAFLKLESHNPAVYDELIHLYLEQKDPENALHFARQAIKLFPDNYSIIDTVAWCASCTHTTDLALAMQKKLVKLKPEDKAHWYDLVATLTEMNDLSALSAVYDRMTDQFPHDLYVWNDKAHFLMDHHQFKQALGVYKKLYALYPENVSVIKEVAYCCEVNGLYTESLNLLIPLVKNYPDDIRVLDQIINLYCTQKQYPSAVELLKKMLSSSSSQRTILLQKLADVFELSGNPADAAEIYEELLSHEPDTRKIKKKLVSLYLWAQKYHKALDHLLWLINRDPGNKEYKKQLLSLYECMHNYDRAIEVTQDLIKLEGISTAYQIKLADLYLAKHDFTHAYPLLKELTHTDASLQILESLAWTCESLGYTGEAISVYEQILSRKNDREEIVVTLAGLYLNSKKYEKAIKLLQKNAVTFPEKTRFREWLADAFYETKQYDRALGMLELLSKQMPGNDKTLKKMADILVAQKKIEHARALYEALYSRNPQDKDIILALGYIHTLTKEYVRAVQYYEQYLTRHPTDYEMQYETGLLYEQMNNPVKSRKYLRNALHYLRISSLNPPVGLRAQKMRARIYDKLRNFSLALLAYEKAIYDDSSDIELFRDYIGFLISYKQYEKAIVKIIRAPSSIRNERMIQQYLAQAYIELELYEPALMILVNLAEQYPDDCDIKADLAFVFLKKGRWDKSLKLYQDILQIQNPGWSRYADIKKEAKQLLKQYGPQLKTGFLLIDEIKKDTRVYYAQSQVYLAHDILFKTGFSRYRFHDSTVALLPNVNEYLSEVSMELNWLIAKYLSLDIGPVVINHGTKDIYSVNFGFTFNNLDDFLFKFSCSLDDKLIDPRGAVPLGGRTNHVDFLINWDVNEVIKVVAEGIQSEYRFDGTVRQFGLSTRPGTRTQFVVGSNVSLLFDPHVALTYRYFWTDSKLDRNYAPLLSLNSKVRSHQFGILYEHQVTEKFYLYGTAFVGNDTERDMFISHLGTYGYETGLRVEVTDNIQTGASYQLLYEKGLESTTGRTHYVNAYALINF